MQPIFVRRIEIFERKAALSLSVLRTFEDSDWENRIKTIVVQLIAISQVNHAMTINIESLAEKDRFERALQVLARPKVVTPLDAVYVVKEGQSVSFLKSCHGTSRYGGIPSSDGRAVVQLKSEGWQIEVAGHPTFAFKSLDVSFENRQHKSEMSVTSIAHFAELMCMAFRIAI